MQGAEGGGGEVEGCGRVAGPCCLQFALALKGMANTPLVGVATHYWWGGYWGGAGYSGCCGQDGSGGSAGTREKGAG